MTTDVGLTKIKSLWLLVDSKNRGLIGANCNRYPRFVFLALVAAVVGVKSWGGFETLEMTAFNVATVLYICL